MGPQPDEGYDSYDALVIGAGAGGLAAAARLNKAGFRTLIVEVRDRVGGRASTVDQDGFQVNTGALIIETGGENGRLFEEIGLSMGTRVPSQPLALRVGERNVPLLSGVVGSAIMPLVELAGIVARRFPSLRPKPGKSLGQALERRGRYVRGLARNVTSAVFAAEPDDVDAAVVFDYFTKPKALDTFGLHPEGSIGPWRALADHFEKTGGVLWLNSRVTGLTFDTDGCVNGAVVQRNGEKVEISTRVVVSNAGPVATVNLCGDEHLPTGYAQWVRSQSAPSTLITVNFASEQLLTAATGVVFFGPTRRLAYAAHLTATCPEMAPAGWYLYAGTSTPHPAVGLFDTDKEVSLLKADLAEKFPGFDSARILSVQVCAGEEWPAQRAIAGRDLPQTTPIANLFNVGDGVREWASGGQSGCVHSARLVVERIVMDRRAQVSSATG